jgi:hypothetical protein
MRHLSLAVVATVLLALSACDGSGGSSQAPASSAETPAAGGSAADLQASLRNVFEGFFHEAFVRGDFVAAYGYLSTECQASLPFAEFEQYFSVGKMFLDGASMSVLDVTVVEFDADRASARITTRLEMQGEPIQEDESETMHFVVQGGAWRFADCEEFASYAGG